MYKVYLLLTILSCTNFVQSRVIQTMVTDNEQIDVRFLTLDQLYELKLKYHHECQAKFNVSNSYIEEMKKPNASIPNTPEMKNILGCVIDKLGYLKGTQVKWDTIKFILAKKYGRTNFDKLVRIYVRINQCERLEPKFADKNEAAYYMTECLKEGYKKAITLTMDN